MRKLNMNSIVSRLLLSFILVIAPIVTSGIFVFLWEKDTIQTQLEDSARDNISFLQTNLENEVDNIKLLQYNLSSDAVITKLATQHPWLSKSEYYTLLLDVRQRLKII